MEPPAGRLAPWLAMAWAVIGAGVWALNGIRVVTSDATPSMEAVLFALAMTATGVTVTDPSRRVVAHVDQALFAGGTPVRQADATCGTSHAFLINSVADIKAPHLLLSNWKNGDDAMLALGNGTLVAQDDGCVGMRPDGGGKPVVLRWPAGTRLAPDGTAVVGESGKRIEFGQRTGFGGGFSGAKLPNECSAARWGGVYEVQQPL